MPIPVTRDVGSTIDFLKRDKPGMSSQQRIAIALNIAREAGAKIKKRKHGRKNS